MPQAADELCTCYGHSANGSVMCMPSLKAYFMLDEMMLAGELQEPSKKAVTRVIEAQDQLVSIRTYSLWLATAPAALTCLPRPCAHGRNARACLFRLRMRSRAALPQL